MHLRVVDRRGEPPRLGRSLVRLVGLVIAIAPMFAGFFPVLVDRRRRALQDFLAGTVVRAEDARVVQSAQAVATDAAPDLQPTAEMTSGCAASSKMRSP